MIDNPVGLLRRVQGLVHCRLLGPHLRSGISFGGVKGYSHFDAAAEHVGQSAVGKIDIKQFFPHISVYHVYDLFISMRCSPDVARLLTRLVTVNGHVPQGAPTSTAIANLVLWNFDLELQRLAAQFNCRVTRFVDDINVSGQAQFVRNTVDWTIRKLNQEGFRINRDKSGVASARTPQVVMGLTVNNRLSVPKTYRKRVRDQVRSAMRFGVTDAGQRSLIGRLNYVARSNRPAAERLLYQLSNAPRAAGGAAVIDRERS